MIPYQNFGIYASVSLVIVIKIVCATVRTYRASMYDNREILSSIPERNESEDDILKWVPKKKHEVLKAKYKCLKKLFEIYDASVIGMLPQNCPDAPIEREPEKRHRRKRTHRSKTDACAGTTEVFNGDVSLSESEKTATAAIDDLTLHQFATDESNTAMTKSVKVDQSTQDFKEVSRSDKESECAQPVEPRIHPYILYYERRRPSRLQRFINRILGLKPERKHDASPTGHVYAASDNNISNINEKRRRRSLRFRRRRAKGIQSESALRDLKTPKIVSYVQSVQKNYLMDTMPRRCPFRDCGMVLYGIINYNDHLNLCHFTDRKYICHYCSEGFSLEYDKIVHENEHIGITKVSAAVPFIPLTGRSSVKIASNTQTDPELKAAVPEEKLKKIVSFFDKISYPNQVIGQLKQDNGSEPNIETTQQYFPTHTGKSKSTESARDMSSCVNLKKKHRKCETLADSDMTCVCDHRVTCRFCGEKFNFRRELSVHVDLEHRVHDKFSKFHSCPGFVTRKVPDVVLGDGMINVQSIGAVSSQTTFSEVSRRKSDHSVKCDPSTNIVYFTSVDSIARRPSAVGSFVKKIRSYKWEPGTKVIHV